MTDQPEPLTTAQQESDPVAGHLDRIDGGQVYGWAALATEPGSHRLVELLIDGVPVDRRAADMHRRDLEIAGISDGHCGFCLSIPAACLDEQPHRLAVRDVESGTELEGSLVLVLSQLQPASLTEVSMQAIAGPTTPRAEPVPALARSVHGQVDGITGGRVRGWAARSNGSPQPLMVEVHLDGCPVARALADRHRSDLAAALIGNGHHAFELVLPESAFDGEEHEVAVCEIGTGLWLDNSPMRGRFDKLHLWAHSRGDDTASRRQLAAACIELCERAVDAELNLERQQVLLDVVAWCEGQPGARRLLQRARQQLERMLRLRLRLSVGGLLSEREIGGTLEDRWAAGEETVIEAHEGAVLLVSATVVPGALGVPRPFVLVLPDSALDEGVHALTFVVPALRGELGRYSFLLGAPRSEQELAIAASDPLWATSPAVMALGSRAKRPAGKPEALEAARAELDDALALFEAADHGPTPAASAGPAGKNDELLPEAAALRDARLQFAHALRAIGLWQEALEQFELAQALDTDSPDAVDGAVRSLLDLGRVADARERLEALPTSLADLPRLRALGDEIEARRRTHRVRTLAFYLPQFHPVAENNAWWGEGFTEWHNVGGATPLFDGHLQPRRPTALGYYDLRLPDAVNAQFELARRYGIDGFCYYYYWFEGRRILNRPLDDLVAGHTGPFPFCICWANEDWTRSWDGSTGEVLLAQNHSTEGDFRFIQDVAPLLRHPDYVRVDGKPMLLIYRADKLADARRTVERWRAWCRAEGIGELHLCAVQSFGFHDPRPLGFDAAVEFPPHCPWDRYPEPGYLKVKDAAELPGLVDGFSGIVYDYEAFARAAIARPREPFPLHRTSMAAWDNTARRGRSAAVYHGFTVKTFFDWSLANARRAALEQDDAVTFVNAWNEWAEGTVLEPDVHFGYENLEAVRAARRIAEFDVRGTHWINRQPLFPEERLAGRERVVLVGHDAFPAGAQINLLHMARCLKRQLDIDVALMLIEGGELLPDYEKVAPTHLIGKEGDWRTPLRTRLRQLRAQGARKAICNTVLTGEVVELFKQEGFRVVGLLHELPTLIGAYGLESQCWLFADRTDAIVCAAQVVADEFGSRYWPDPVKVAIAPQGIAFNGYHDRRAAMRRTLRQELGLPAECRIVMGCGYGDTRKGIMSWVQMAASVQERAAPGSVAFVWVGALDDQLAPYVKVDVERLGLGPVFRVTGRTKDPARYFIAGDVFVLTSREDPFPSVVMEAFDAYMPVVAFEGGGGYVEIVGPETGALTPYLDVAAMSCAVLELLADDVRRAVIGEHNHRICRERFGYEPYMRKLLALLAGVPARQVQAGHLTRQAWCGAGAPPRVSVIVPNYNYARYLELRLRSILGQTLVPHEIIVLDDASSDDSVAIVEAIARRSTVPLRLERAVRNSGNPFVQWSRGLELVTGDLIWIAEADDYCEPILLETLASELEDPSVVMAWCDSVMVDAEGRGNGAQYKDYYGRRFGHKWQLHFRIEGRRLVDDCLLVENVVPNASAVLFRRDAVRFDLAPMRQYRFSGDWWFWLSLALQGHVAYRADPLNYHRRHAHSVMGDVLRSVDRLIPETVAFYERLAAAHPDLIDRAMLTRIVDRIDHLHATMPGGDSEAASAALEQGQHRLLALVADETSAPAESALELVCLPETVVQPDGTALEPAIVALCRRPTTHTVLLGMTNADAAALANRLELSPDRVHAIEPAELALPPGILPGRSVVTASLCRLLDTDAGTRPVAAVYSHGFGAHAWAAALSREHPRLAWVALAGAEFDSLLGQGTGERAQLLEEARQVVMHATEAWFVGARPSHAYARLCQTARRLVDRWQPQAAASVRDPRQSVAVAGTEPLSVWRHEVAAWRAEGTSMSEEPGRRLRLIAWGERYAQLVQEAATAPGIEVVGAYAPPRELAKLGSQLWVMGDQVHGEHRLAALRAQLPLRLLSGSRPPTS